MNDTREQLVEILRGRVLRGLQAGTLRAGDRLPSARDLGGEFGTDHRIILAAYRQLVDEGLVELRPRGGIYVAAAPPSPGGVPPLPVSWFAELFAEGLAREIPGPELYEWLRRSTETLRLRAVAITSTTDQGYALSRELRDDFGIETEPVLSDEVRGAPEVPLAVKRADLLVTTEAHAVLVNRLGRDLHKHVCVIQVRPDLTRGEWAMLLRRPVYAVVASRDFARMLHAFFADVPGASNLHTLVFREDDLSTIPPEAPTYVTQRVRADLGDVRIPGRILPATRTISTQSAREIFDFVVRQNVEALRRDA